MNGRALYIEIDEYCRAWLRNLIAADLICPGDVVGDILDVRPRDLDRYNQVHAFAGIGIWSAALRDAGIRDTDQVWTGSCPCFPGDVMVLTKRGLIPISNVIVGDRVLSHRSRWQRVTRVGSETSDCVRLKGQGHFGLVCTPDHPFLVGQEEWAPARSMIGKRWATVRSVPEASIPPLTQTRQGYFYDRSVQSYRVKGEKDGKPVYVGVFKTPEAAADARASAVENGIIDARGADAVDIASIGFARFLGYWLGDGWVTGSAVTICGNLSDRDLLDEILRGANLPASHSIERTTCRARCGSKSLAAWLTEHFGNRADNKRIPAWLYGMPEDFRTAFLDGYAEADGHKEHGPRSGPVRRWTTVSRALAIGVRILLNQTGISASITVHASAGAKFIEGRSVTERPFFRVTAYETARSFHFDRDHGWGLVRSVKPAGEQRVFNLSVEQDESYTADGIVVHNCQPFSAAGQRGGFADERHLWPAFFHLIKECGPPVVFGEQVASPDGLQWFDLVSSDLEGAHYAIGAADLCAAGIAVAAGQTQIGQETIEWIRGAILTCPDPFLAAELRDYAEWLVGQVGVGAPHIRQRLYWVADADSARCGTGRTSEESARPGSSRVEFAGLRAAGAVADVSGPRSFPGSHTGIHRGEESSGPRHAELERYGSASVMGHTDDAGSQGRIERRNGGDQRLAGTPSMAFWSDAEWMVCTDGQARPVEIGTFPLAHGERSRVGKLRAYGNQIVWPLATQFILAAQEAIGDVT